MSEFTDKTTGDTLTASEYNNLAEHVTGQVGKGPTILEGFDVPDVADASTYTLQSGQSLSVPMGSAEIKNGVLTPTSGAGRTIVTIDGLTGNTTQLKGRFRSLSGGPVGIVLTYIDNNNYIYVTVKRNPTAQGALRIFEVSSGSESEINEIGKVHGIGVTYIRFPLECMTSTQVLQNRYGAWSFNAGGGANNSNFSNTFDPSSVGVILGEDTSECFNLFGYVESL